LSFTQLEDRETREEQFLKAIYYIKDIRSAYYYQKLGSDYFIAAQNIEKGPVNDYFQKAINWYQKAIGKDPKRERMASDMAQVYMIWSLYIEDGEGKNEKIKLGEQAFERALELSPGRQMIYWEWGRSLLFISKTKEGIAKYLYAVKMDPAVGRSYFELGKAYKATGEEELAREAFDKARELGWTRGSENDSL
jgi:tetratricopeptide (TPR) repeat protein